MRRFVEKPDVKTAAQYVSSKRFLWNAGMFIWRAAVLKREFLRRAADIGTLIDEVAAAASVPEALERRYPGVQSISFDFAVMEKNPDILVARSEFDWVMVLSGVRGFPEGGGGHLAIGLERAGQCCR